MGSSKYLHDIQDIVIKFAKVISQVLHVDVEIVDDGLMRIAGTGIFAKRVNHQAPGQIYREVLNGGIHRIIQFPREDPYCLGCNAKETCLETMEISTPIRYHDKNIGVIGLICTTLEQKDHINANLASHVAFLAQIADLISAKVTEHLSMEETTQNLAMLSRILDDVENGVIVISKENRIEFVNRKAMVKLRAGESVLGETLQLSSVSPEDDQNREFRLELHGRQYMVAGKLMEFNETYRSYDRILIFRTMKDIKRNAYRITQQSRLITKENLVGHSRAMQDIRDTIEKVAPTFSTVFIRGESGTGKELIARAIHAESDRKAEPFIGINCAAIPDTLLESELFGYVKGAFSGASGSGRIGKFELANKGTLFLDEIGDMPLYLQSKVLRILQERAFSRIGANDLIDLDIRVIAATNRNIEDMIIKNQFRRDLFYRINVIPINVPPLRERTDDIALLFEMLLAKYNEALGKSVTHVDSDVLPALLAYAWPGNVRELENVVQYLIALADSSNTIHRYMLPEAMLHLGGEAEGDAPQKGEPIQTLSELEHRYIEKVVARYGTTTEGKKKAAKALGIGIATLYRKLGVIYQNEN
ncbi:putative sigma-54-dependent transcriptional regulator YgeV [Clostridiaceae bacterium JG1575]|nr:putative sigma-54-dependent transcriptional regulator YgeV [Clostridiaceae bacterium JG1575]